VKTPLALGCGFYRWLPMVCSRVELLGIAARSFTWCFPGKAEYNCETDSAQVEGSNCEKDSAERVKSA